VCVITVLLGDIIHQPNVCYYTDDVRCRYNLESLMGLKYCLIDLLTILGDDKLLHILYYFASIITFSSNFHLFCTSLYTPSFPLATPATTSLFENHSPVALLGSDLRVNKRNFCIYIHLSCLRWRRAQYGFSGCSQVSCITLHWLTVCLRCSGQLSNAKHRKWDGHAKLSTGFGGKVRL